MTEETRDEYDIRTKAAETQHAVFHSNSEATFNMVAGFSNSVMRAPALAAAGGIAAILGFFAAHGNDLRGSVAIDDFTAALSWFFGAVLLCVIAPGTAYFAQTSFVSAFGAYSLDYDFPYVHKTNRSKQWAAIGTTFQVFTIVVVMGSFVALSMGAWHFMNVARFLTR